jgi:signal peptidase I
MSETSEATKDPNEGDWIDTLQGLLVAFVVAMVFRGFVLEGFFIPTGSMAPTLRGQHVRMRGEATGYAYDADAGPLFEGGAASTSRAPITDPMVTRQYPVGEQEVGLLRAQSVSGDRVLTIKYLPWVFEPHRWDVPVFRNPPDPVNSGTMNYIKRLVGMPNEGLVLADGDVFTGPLGAPGSALRIQRKPEMVQRAVWQPVWRSDWGPVEPRRMEQALRKPWPGPALKPSPAERGRWKIEDSHAWTCSGDASARLEFDLRAWPLTDWNAYNVWRRVPEFPTSDIRMSGAFEPADPSRFGASMELVTRGLRIEAGVRPISGAMEVFALVQSVQGDKPLAAKAAMLGTAGAAPRVLALEIWHVDQKLWVFVGGKAMIELPYELDADGTSPAERLAAAGVEPGRYAQDPVSTKPRSADSLAWNLGGSSFTARNLRVDRDLYYQPGVLLPGNQVVSNGPIVVGRAFACDPENPAQLGENDFLMLGDNSPASRDGRFWGRPHPILKGAIGFDRPFVVPRELLVGAAWCVYFPATYPLGTGLDMRDPAARAPGIVPNFGSLRFIR